MHVVMMMFTLVSIGWLCRKRAADMQVIYRHAGSIEHVSSGLYYVKPCVEESSSCSLLTPGLATV
jgi:hypothetical protein